MTIRVDAPGGGPGGRRADRKEDLHRPDRADLHRLGYRAGLVSGISVRQGVPVVHHSPMTESATVPAEGATNTAVDSTDTPDGTAHTGASQPSTADSVVIPAVQCGAWPSPSPQPTSRGARSACRSRASSARTCGGRKA